MTLHHSLGLGLMLEIDFAFRLQVLENLVQPVLKRLSQKPICLVDNLEWSNAWMRLKQYGNTKLQAY